MAFETIPDRPRADAPQKVMGKALFAADHPVAGLLHAMTVPSRINKGSITSIDSSAALAVPGVLRVFTHADFADLKTTPASRGAHGQPGKGYQPMTGTKIVHRGEPVAMVVADTLENAIEGARLVMVEYAEQPFVTVMEESGADTDSGHVHEISAGNAQSAYAGAAHKVEAEYLHPQQHNNPMELISTTAAFEDGVVRIYEGTQGVESFAGGMAGILGLDPASFRGSSPYIGGGFGQKNGIQEQSALVTKAAMIMRRPIKLVMPRDQLFHTASFRPRSRHKLQLAADAQGKLVAGIYHTEQQNSRYDGFGTEYNSTPVRMYAWPNWSGADVIKRVDSQSAGYQRAPHEHPSSYAVECAMDELASQIGIDPVEFRIANDSRKDPVTGKPFSSRHLRECLQRGAQMFDWSRRAPEPGAMRAANGDLIGLGVACGCYKASMSPCITQLQLSANGNCSISLSGHEMGQGLRSVIAAEVIGILGVDPDKLDIRVGDTGFAPQHLTGGSWGTGSVAPAARAAALKLKQNLAQLAGVEDFDEPAHRVLSRTRRPSLSVEVNTVPIGSGDDALAHLRAGIPSPVGPEYPEFFAFSWIAHFVEVHVTPSTGQVWVPRVVSVADCGRVMNHRTAESQIKGGVVWGISSALREMSDIERRYGGVLNNDLAEYIVPVNADIGTIDVDFVGKPDTQLNISGVKGVGEVAMVGATAAVVNAMHHATGKRIRHVPIRVEDII